MSSPGSLPDVSVQSGVQRMYAGDATEERAAGGLVKKRILLVDVNSSERRALADQLELYQEFETVECETGAQALALIDKEGFDGILLDVELPDADGREVCRTVRRRDVHVPVIVLSARNGEADEIPSLEAGANDFLTKPLRFSVLVARVRTHLRQAEWSGNATLLIGPYAFRPTAKLLYQNATGKQIQLTDKECVILNVLCRAGGFGVSCEVLYREIWGYASALVTHKLQTHIYRLRQKIEPEPSRPTYLLSRPGGYRLVRRPEGSR